VLMDIVLLATHVCHAILAACRAQEINVNVVQVISY
jgi:hypothetical protein